MKTLFLISSHILFLSFGFSQENNFTEMFPLSVGEKYFYSFNSGSSNQWSHYSSTNNGIVKLEITGMIDSPDSIRWQIHQWRRYWRTIVDQSPYPSSLIIDSADIEIIELKNGMHEIYTKPYAKGSVFSFIKSEVDSEKIFRYSNSGISNSFIKTYGVNGNGDYFEFTFTADSGLTKSIYSNSYPASGSWNWARYYLTDSNNILLSTEELSTEIPEDLLGNNYPNPFNPVTKIYYTLSHAGSVTIKVYNILGKIVTSLVDDYKTAGNYSIDFDGFNLSSGIYIYQMKTNGYTKTKKMILLR